MSKGTSRVHQDEAHHNSAVSNDAGNHDGNPLGRAIDPRMKEALAHYKYVGEHLDSELKMNEEKLHNIQLTNRALKQNLIDMDKEKQRIIIEFHEQYRKLSVNIKLANQIEEDLQRLKEFLENAKDLENDIQTSKDEGVTQRQNILASYQKNFEEFKKIELAYTEKMNRSQKMLHDMMQEAERQKLCHKTNSALVMYQKICRDELGVMERLLQTTLESCNEMRAEMTCIQNRTETEANNANQKFSCLAAQIKSETRALVSSVRQLKNEIASEFAAKQEKIYEFKAKNIQLVDCLTKIDREIANNGNQIEILEKEMQQKRDNCAQFELKIQNLVEQETESRRKKTNENLSGIQSLLAMIEIKTKDLQRLKEEIEKRMIEKETLIEEREKHESVANLQKKLSDAANLETSLAQKNEILVSDLGELKKSKQAIELQILHVKTKMQKEKLRVTELEEILKSSSNNFREDTEAQKILDILLQSKGEQDSTNEIVSCELNGLYNQISAALHTYTDSEIELEQIQQENTKLDDIILQKKEVLAKILEDTEGYKDSIRVLKQNVKEGRATTQQELNKKYNMMVNAKNQEKEKCDKLKNEMRKIKNRINQMKTKTDDQRFDEIMGNATTS